MSSQWKGKSAVVCGATAGLGRAFAFELAQQQVQRLVIVARSVDALQAMQAELLDRFGDLEVVCLPADLRDKDQVERACELLRSSGTKVDLLIQAVGQSDRGRLMDLTSQRLNELIEVNVLTSLHAIQCFRPLLSRVADNQDRDSTGEAGKKWRAGGERDMSERKRGETGRGEHSIEDATKNVSGTPETGWSARSTEDASKNVSGTPETGWSARSTEDATKKVSGSPETGRGARSTEDASKNVSGTPETGRSARSTEVASKNVIGTPEAGRSARSTEDLSKNWIAPPEAGRSERSTEFVSENASGTVVLVGSLASLFAPRFLGAYAIAKHGLAALAQQARLELAEEGIHVLLACPGPIARDDSGVRYDQLARDLDLPEAVRKPGGGAKIRGLSPQRLVRDILTAAAAKQQRIIRPRKAQWLHWLSAISSAWGDRLLRKNSG